MVTFYVHVAFISLLFHAKTESVATCNPPNRIAHDLNIQNELLNNGWVLCYQDSHTDIQDTTMTSLTQSCPTGPEYNIFVAAYALYPSSSQHAMLGAFAPSSVLLTFTNSSDTAYLPTQSVDEKYTIFWYNNQQLRTFGFAPNASIQLKSDIGYNSLDAFDLNNENRLSWSYSQDVLRAGSRIVRSNNTFAFAIYSKHCVSDTEENNDILTTASADGMDEKTETMEHWIIGVSVVAFLIAFIVIAGCLLYRATQYKTVTKQMIHSQRDAQQILVNAGGYRPGESQLQEMNDVERITQILEDEDLM